MDKIIDYFKNNHGYARLKDLKNNRIHTDTIRKLLTRGVIVKIKPGLYKLSEVPEAPETEMVEICLSMPLTVVCLHSALRYHGLTALEPPHLMVALPRESKPMYRLPQQVKVYFFAAKNHRVGIEEMHSAAGTFRIYNPEKTIVDCFRYRNKLGLDLAIDGLKNYMAKFEHDTGKLIEYARFGRMFNVMKPYLDTLIRTV